MLRVEDPFKIATPALGLVRSRNVDKIYIEETTTFVRDYRNNLSKLRDVNMISETEPEMGRLVDLSA